MIKSVRSLISIGSDFSNGLNDPRGARIQLRWDDSWGGAARDLDLYVRNSAGDVVAASQDYQSGGLGQIPYEFIHSMVPGNYCGRLQQKRA